MDPEFWKLFFEGMLGPLLLELIKIAVLQDGRKIVARYSEVRYWVATATLFILSGLVVAIMNVGHPVSLLQAAQLGMNAPAIAGGWATARTARTRQRDDRAGFIRGVTHPSDGGTAQPSRGGKIDRLAQVLAW
jgi:hypothetical protein